ncbi:hypothetical protein M0804_009808 [Polistes exclamans]|nr:hypothetical protein M0804_009808 [Polistes exclamans]
MVDDPNTMQRRNHPTRNTYLHILLILDEDMTLDYTVELPLTRITSCKRLWILFTKFFIILGDMEFHNLNILKQNLKETARKLGICEDFYFQQDNNLKHTAGIFKE